MKILRKSTYIIILPSFTSPQVKISFTLILCLFLIISFILSLSILTLFSLITHSPHFFLTVSSSSFFLSFFRVFSSNDNGVVAERRRIGSGRGSLRAWPQHFLLGVLYDNQAFGLVGVARLKCLLCPNQILRFKFC